MVARIDGSDNVSRMPNGHGQANEDLSLRIASAMAPSAWPNPKMVSVTLSAYVWYRILSELVSNRHMGPEHPVVNNLLGQLNASGETQFIQNKAAAGVTES